VIPTETVRFSRVKSILKRFFKRKPVLLPPELWQAIFKNLNLRDALNVRLTCKTFAALAKPQAFSTYNTLPYMPDGDSLSRRVEWWTSESISPLVRQCSITSNRLWICHDDSPEIPDRTGKTSLTLYMTISFNFFPGLSTSGDCTVGIFFSRTAY
jgi:hypothetical protein